MKTLHDRLELETSGTEQHAQRLQAMRQMAERLSTEISEQRKKTIEPLLKISSDQEGRILRIQDEIVQKVKQRYQQMKSYEGESEAVVRQLGEFFERRAKAGEIIAQLNAAEEDIKKELTALVLKAKTFDLALKEREVNEHILNLEKKYEEYSGKKRNLTEYLDRLRTLLTAHGDPLPPPPAA
jgi:hypothetical protein